MAAEVQVYSFQGQPLALSHLRTTRWPPSGTRSKGSRWPSATAESESHVYALHSHPLALAHLRTSRWPPPAAAQQVSSFQGHPLALAHLRTSRWPPLAAYEQVSGLHSKPLARSHCKVSKWPPLAANAQIRQSSSRGHPWSMAHFTSSTLQTDVASLQAPQRSLALRHAHCGGPASFGHPAEQRERGGSFQRLRDDFYLAVRQIREGGRHVGDVR